MKHILHVAVFAVLFGSASLVAADEGTEALRKSENLYKSSKYDSTISIIRAYLKAHGEDRVSRDLVPLLMEALMRKGDYEFSQRLFQIYLKRFPSSPFVPRLWYLEGIALIKGKEYDNACLAFTNALNGGVSPVLDSLIQANVQKMCERALTGDECTFLAAKTDLHPHIEEIVKYYDLVKMYESGRLYGARQKATDFVKKFSRSLYAASVKEVLEKSEKKDKGIVEIGVLAPISGNDADIGKQIVQGIQLAIDRFSPFAEFRTKVIMADTRGNMIETARKVQELINEHHVTAIIGPVLSQNAIVAASSLVGKDIVMITPTATDDGIAALSSNIFQMNVPLGVLGARIAKYAMDNCMIRDFAIFAPSSEYGSALAKGFKDEVEKRGAEIVDFQTYEEGSRDCRAQFENLRKVLTLRKQQKTALEKSLEGESSAEQKSKRGDPKADKRYVPPEDTTLQVGGLFVPSESEDAVMIATQLLFHRIHAQLLGSTGWYSPKTILDGKEYVNNALISTNFQSGSDNDKEWVDFKNTYRARYSADPERVAALGYDAAAIVLQAVKDKGGDRATGPQIAQAMASVKNYKGASGTISFDPVTRVNSEAAIMKIKDKQFIRVQ